jgi:glycosyltransferase involved in cell wall biosynthesis
MQLGVKRFIEGYEYELINFPINSKCLVGILCFSYNQKNYVKDAIEGMLSQKTNFDYQIFVIDDASTDGTTEILKDYAQRYPNLIALALAKENTFKSDRKKKIYKELRKLIAIKVKYIAICEGDDYWTDNLKIQIQVDYLESNNNCQMYLHNSWWNDCSSGSMMIANPYICNDERALNIEELLGLRNEHPATASSMYRASLWLNAPDYLHECSVGDYNIMTYAATVGEVHYSSRVMCVYRYMSGNSTSDIMTSDEGTGYSIYHVLGIALYLLCLDYDTDFVYHNVINRMIISFAWKVLDFVDASTVINEEITNRMNPYKLHYNQRIISYIHRKIRQRVDDKWISIELRQYLERFKNFYIFGTGYYAQLLIKQLENNNYYPEAFIKTNTNVNETEFCGYPIKSIFEIKIPLDYGIVVSVIPTINDGIDEEMKSLNIMNYIYAYGINKCEINDSLFGIKSDEELLC